MTNKQRLEDLRQQAKTLAEQIDQLEGQINNAQPTSGLLGRWATHPEYGDVLIAEDRATDKGTIHVVYLRDDMKCGARGYFVFLDDLEFPEQTTRPQDVPIGEAWLVNADDGDASTTNTPAVKKFNGMWGTSGDKTGGVCTWYDDEVTLITPLIPARPHDTPETVTTEEEYEALPQGSIVAEPGKNPWTRKPHVWVQAGATVDDVVLAGTTRQVLRRGWGE